MIQDVRDNNYLQPNRYFNIRGEVKYVEKESEYSKIIVKVFNYYDIDNEPDEVIIFFRNETKKVIDRMVKPHVHVSVMGDILIKDKKIYFDGKVVEIYKTCIYQMESHAKVVDPKDTSYDKAF